MLITSQEAVTPAVLSAMSDSAPRLKAVMAAFVRHLHAFSREAMLTEEELEAGIAFLNQIGKTTNDTHNEGVLFADAVGLSTLVCLLNNGMAGATETTAALLGPFWRMHSPLTPNGGSILRSETPGPALFVEGRVVDPNGQPLQGVEVDVWQASPVGLYENQDESQGEMNLRGKFTTDADGRFWFRSVKPAGYPVPTHGPVGRLLRAQNRHPYRPAHLHFLALKPGWKTLVTQVFADDDQYLESDVVFGVTRELVGDFRVHETGLTPSADVHAPWFTLAHVFVMTPGESTLPTPPIK